MTNPEFYRRALLLAYNHILIAFHGDQLKILPENFGSFIAVLDVLQDASNKDAEQFAWSINDNGDFRFVSSRLGLEERRRRVCGNGSVYSYLFELAEAGDSMAREIYSILLLIFEKDDINPSNCHITENGTLIIPSERRKHLHAVKAGRKGGQAKVAKGFASKTAEERKAIGKAASKKRWPKPDVKDKEL
jgi:hypothetical protein